MGRTARVVAIALAAFALAFSAAAGSTSALVTGPSAPYAIPSGPYVAGVSYFGRNNYIEYMAGNLPVIFSAAHGGSLTPSEIPNRTDSLCGGDATTTRDTNTEELARAIQTAFFNRTGKYPHVIINRLHRQKLDANRDRAAGACGDNEANIAWDEFQSFITIARNRVTTDQGKGWYTDVHGHGHSIQRLELGYLLSGSDLRLSNTTLDGSTTYEDRSSVRTFSQASPLSFSALLRGSTSLGTLMGNAGYPSTPATQDPAPDANESYFSGGYNTDVHGCDDGGSICGIQIEHNMTGVRDTATNRAKYATALVAVYESYLGQNFGITFMDSLPGTPTGLTATAGDGRVGLSWNASSGVASYNVSRSTTSGGPYSAIATGIGTTGYTDTGVTNGTAYYYVVSAVNSLGESPPSTQASATPQAAVGGFTLSASPSTRTLTRGSSATYTVTIARTGSFTGPVSLAATQTPAATGLTYSFTQNPATGASSTFRVTASSTATLGAFSVTVTGTSGQLQGTATVMLNVQAGNCQGSCN